MGIGHFDDADVRELALGHIQGRWLLCDADAGFARAGLSRIQVPAGGWSTPVHEHGREEEIFHVLSGRGLSWQDGTTAEVGPGDAIVHLAGGGAHTLHALEPLDVLAFGPRIDDEALRFPRLGASKIGGRMIASEPGHVDGAPAQFLREAELGPPDLPDAPSARPSTIVHLDCVEPRRVERGRVARVRRNLGRAAGSVTTGLQHVEVAPGRWSAPLHCHSLEEEIFVVLDGDGVLVLHDDGSETETAIRPGHVVARPAATGVAHAFRAGEGGLTYLAYGMREPNDICFYPSSGKISFGGVGVIGRLERLDYWDGEP